MEHHTEFTCGLDLSLQSPTQVMDQSPHIFSYPYSLQIALRVACIAFMNKILAFRAR